MHLVVDSRRSGCCNLSSSAFTNFLPHQTNEPFPGKAEIVGRKRKYPKKKSPHLIKYDCWGHLGHKNRKHFLARWKKSQDIVQTTLLSSPHSTLLTNIWWQKGWGIISKPTSFTWGNKHSNETMSEPEHCQNEKKGRRKVVFFFCRFESREENTSGSMPIYSRDKVLYWVLLWGQKQEERDYSVGKQKKKPDT